MNKRTDALTVDVVLEPIRHDLAEIAQNKDFVANLYSKFALAARLNEKILKCDPVSLRDELLKAAADNLVPDGNEAAIIPYNTKHGMKANYQPMVHGIIKRVRELGGVFSITVDVVRENDTFEANLADLTTMKHSYPLNQSEEDRGEIIAAYALFRDADGRIIHPELMNKAQLEKVRKASKAKDGGVWKDWPEEMCKKSVIRRGAKRIPTDSTELSKLLTRMDSIVELKDITPAEPERAALWGAKPAEPETDETPSAPDTSHVSSQGANEAPEQQETQLPPLDPTVAQEYSNHLWKSQRNFEQLKIDSQQFQTKNIEPYSYDDKMRERLSTIRDIHKTRVMSKDAKAGDARAYMDLANMSIESPELEDAAD